MASPPTAIDRRGHLRAPTLRTDTWWLQPLVTVLVLAGFVAYGIWVAFVDNNYFADPYISPFYSPCLATKCGAHATAAIFGTWWPLSPALIVLPFPLGFRLTCYYYRKAYYRSFWWAPPACAVRDARARYTGETKFPLILQNVHRYFFYLTLPFPIILLGLYSLSCHSCRHLCGGHVDKFSRAPVRFWLWRRVSALNARHMLYAWVSLVFVALADLYVRLVATGAIHDPRLL